MTGTKLCKLFHRIVSDVYTIDAAHSPENRITGILAPTADRILEMFLSQGDDSERPFEALFYACYVAKEVFQTPQSGLERQLTMQTEKWCQSALLLAERVVRTRVVVRYIFLSDSPDVVLIHWDLSCIFIDNSSYSIRF